MRKLNISMGFLVFAYLFLYSICAFATYSDTCGHGIPGAAPQSCICDMGYVKDNTGKCRGCDTANGYGRNESDECVKCVDLNKIVYGNKCVCKEGYSGDGCLQCADGFEKWPADSTTCVPKCDADHERNAQGACIEKCKEGEKRGDDDKCVPECPLADTEKSDTGECVCKADHASYGGMKDIPCIECGPNKTGISAEGECKCKNSYHVSLKGDCVSDSLSCSDDDPKAILENKKCVCKPQFAYTVDPADPTHKPYCKMIPCVDGTDYNEAKGECLSPDAIACIEKGDEWDAEAGKCLGVEASGDCSCNFTGAEPTFAQALIPFIAVLFGTGGMVAWRRKGRGRSR